MRVRLSSEAREDLFTIGDYIARENPPRAQSFVAELAAKCAGLGEMPKAHPLVPRYAQNGIRRRVHGNYQIFYRTDDPKSSLSASCTARGTMPPCCFPKMNHNNPEGSFAGQSRRSPDEVSAMLTLKSDDEDAAIEE